MKRLAPSFPIQWTLTQLDQPTGQPRGDELPAQVPGDVFSDLLRAGKIPDPYLGLNSEEVQWVNDCDWLYRGRSELAAQGGERLWLEFMGLDYRYAIRWNEQERLRGEGMFSRVLLEADPGAKAENLIEVRFSGLRDRWVERKFPPWIINTEPVRRNYLKTQMGFGWDFAPRLKGCGIWDQVSLFRSGPALIQDLCLRPRNDGQVELTMVLDSSTETKATLELKFCGETFSGYEKQLSLAAPLQPGRNFFQHRLQIEDPQLWWPWDQGRPELYRLEAAVVIAGRRSDAVEESFGFREFGWTRNPDSPKRALDWTLVINGRREFLRGANLVPPEAMSGRLSEDRYRKLLELAREANLNTLRLWGGGNRERSAFYEICDRMGILIWQEFPVGCINWRLPRSGRFLKLLRQECGEIVRQLRNHPCIIMWCGGNEFNVHLNRPQIEVMAHVCQDLDPTRRFVPASPYRGDAHNWLVWHTKGNLSDYFSEKAQVVSEFGLQAAPAVESLKEFLPGELLWPIGAGWAHHHLGLGKMRKYVKHFGGPGRTLEDLVNASQEAQAHFLQRALEYWRRHKYQKSGALIWQWNEPWPCISWSVVDYYLRPKRSFAAVRRAFQPLLVSAEFEQKSYRPGDRLSARLFLVNDLPCAFPELVIEVKASGELVETLRAGVGPDQVAQVAELSLALPTGSPPRLELFAQAAGQPVSHNSYDLTFHDPEPATPLMRRFYRRWWQFLSE